MKKKILVTVSLLAALALTLALILLMDRASPVLADPGVHYVGTGGDCGGASPCHDSLQEAVDAAAPGDEIRVATGTHSDPSTIGSWTQVAYISKTLSIQGGYNADFSSWDPDLFPTYLDAKGLGRGLVITAGAHVAIKGLYVTGGQAPAGDAGGCSASDGGHGGGIYIAAGAHLTMTSCSVISNTAGAGATVNTGPCIRNGGDGGHGGGIYNAGNLTLEQSTVADNLAGAGGAGDDWSGGGGHGGGGGSGGAIYNVGHMSLQYSSVVSNSAGYGGEGGSGAGSPGYMGGKGGHGGDGGGIYNDATATTWELILSNNEAGYGGKGGGGYSSNWYGGDGGSGGGIYNAGTMTLNGGSCGASQAGDGGNCYSTCPQSSGGSGGSVYSEGPFTAYGGAFNDSSSGSAGSCIGGVCGSSAENGNGGGLYLTGTAVISGSSIISNTSDRYGGGLYIYASSDITLSGNTVASNTASFDGGGAYLAAAGDSLFVLSGNELISNSADSGGGLYLDSGRATMSENTFAQNTAGTCGGLCLLSGDKITLTGNLILTNSATSGFAGGLDVYSTDAAFNGNTVAGNSAFLGGGGVLVEYSTAALEGNTIVSNSSTYDGGGVMVYESDATFINNVIADNAAGNAGSGLLVYDASARLLHNTIAGNTGPSSAGVFVYDSNLSFDPTSTAALTNTIVAGHLYGIYVSAGTTATLENTLWGSIAWVNVVDWFSLGSIYTGTVNIWGDPAFVAPGSRNYHIGPTSAARDAGMYAGVTTDIDGHLRPMGHGYDIGADELLVALEVEKWATPVQAVPGAPLTYTIRVTNTGDVALTATISDVLPGKVTPGGTFTWTASIAASGGVWTEQFSVTVEAGYTGGLTNVVQVSSVEGASGAFTHTMDTLPVLSFDSAAYIVVESEGSATITVTLSQAGAATAKVEYATGDGSASAGSDYAATADKLSFPPGTTVLTFTVAITDDALYEYNEALLLTLSNVENALIGGSNPVWLTILNDDGQPSVGWSSTAYSVLEAEGSETITAALDAAAGVTVTVEYETADGSAGAGSDYTAISGTLTFTPSVTVRSLSVSIVVDDEYEDDETVILTLSDAIAASLGGNNPAVLTITDEAKVYLPLVLRNY
jgi:uncharacterized repeat protein (TIGR01451 family)